MISSMVKWGYQDNFKSVYLRKDFEQKKRKST